MTEKNIIEIKNISKKYNITHNRGGYLTIRDILMNIVKNPFKYVKDKAKKAVGVGHEDFWALKDISFNIKKGEVIGIIGRNGAGKSTLLKILSQITPPTEGVIKMHGKVGSLLEVGTGFHPELTGRENIFLNGAILGMTRVEIAKKFDQIVEFAGIEKFLDTPVKYYSSGMYVRLAFSVAAHIEPDILIIDEVLAVGDAEFQKKCLGKMDEITKKDGRTILFVSHNIGAIRQLCKKTILLNQGKLEMMGETEEVIRHYLKSVFPYTEEPFKYIFNKSKNLTVTSLKMANEKRQIPVGEDLDLSFEYSYSGEGNRKLLAALSIIDTEGNVLCFTHNQLENLSIVPEQPGGKIRIKIPKLNLKPENYTINLVLVIDGMQVAELNLGKIQISAQPFFASNEFPTNSFPSMVLFRSEWSHNKL